MGELYDTVGALSTKVENMGGKFGGLTKLDEKVQRIDKTLSAMKRKCEGPVKCGKFGFCVGFEGR